MDRTRQLTKLVNLTNKLGLLVTVFGVEVKPRVPLRETAVS